ncbi:MAG TPA: hypothetical protein VFK02_26720 [Kofleriaceae bacterium]|nr:hypothetical protein [Kofleriaceae bacterium]
MRRPPTPSTTGRAAVLAMFGLAVGAAAPAAWAKGKTDDGDDAKGEVKDEVKIDDGDEAGATGASRSAKNKATAAADDRDDAPAEKQDLTGHDVAATKKQNVFERDRFFVDKSDTSKTERGTLIQGSLTSTTFGYSEAGGTITPPNAMSTMAIVPSASQFNRVFTDLRLQTDFRHISGGRWEARVDVRGRAVTDPGTSTPGFNPGTNSTVQSGFLGKNELEIKELWLVRNGARSDVFIGRQFISDLGAIKIDGVRVDYASSPKFTVLGFGGLYPIRGSRSITSDYTELQSNPDAMGQRSSAGRFTGATGLGAAFRTVDAYGSFGGVALVPFSSESPRVFGTSTGYWRYGSKLDLYHLAVIDLVGSNAVNAGLTNLSLGANWKPDQRLRGTLAFNRVDTETLNVQAQAFLANPDPGVNAVQNEAYVQRIATNEGRASLSAGLGDLQRFELTAATTYRYRGEVVLSPPPQNMGMAPTTQTLPAAQSVEVYGAITDRHSIGGLRIGLDGSRIFGVGSSTYQRTSVTSVRASVARELANGHGEWETEVAYSTTNDDSAGATCTDIPSCSGASKSNILSVGGNLYYRINRDWFVFGSAFLNRNAITHVDMMTSTTDPSVLGVSGYFRIAYRF